MADADLALGAVFRGAGRSQRVRMAEFFDRAMGILQGLDHPATTAGVWSGTGTFAASPSSRESAAAGIGCRVCAYRQIDHGRFPVWLGGFENGAKILPAPSSRVCFSAQPALGKAISVHGISSQSNSFTSRLSAPAPNCSVSRLARYSNCTDRKSVV